MTATTIPKEIRDFVARYLPSVEHLETLMVLRRNTAKSWSAQDAASRACNRALMVATYAARPGLQRPPDE